MAQREALNRRSRDRDDEDNGRERRSSSRERDDDRRSSRSSSRGGGTKWKGYQRRSSEDVRSRAEQTGGSYDSIVKQGIDMFRPKDGENTIRFLPPTWENAKHYGYDVWVHPFVGVDESTYLCLDKNKKERCPLCIAAKQAKDAGDEDEYKGLRPRQRVLAWILNRNADDDKPMVYDMSWSFDRDVAALCDTKKGTLFIDDPDEGFDLSFRRTGKGLNTRYIGVQVDRDSSPMLEDQRAQDELQDFLQENPIPDLLKYHSPDYLQKIIEGTTAEQDEDLDSDAEERPARRGRDREEDDERPARGRSRRDEEDERDDDGRERRRGRDTEGEEEERPARGRSRRAEPEEEDERPARRTRREEDDRPRSRARDRDEEDAPEPDEPDAEEEPEEEDRPRRRSRR